MARVSKREIEIKKDIDKVLRQMCFGRFYRERSDSMVDRLYNTDVIYDRCVKDDIVIDEDMIVTALMEVVFKDYEYPEN
jgi:hypothetical protein